MNIHVPEQKTGRRKTVWTKENVAIAERMWTEGFTSTAIGQRFGVTRGSVTAMACMYRDRFPVRTGSSAEKPDEDRAEWLRKASALWMEGRTAYAIAVVTGVSSGAAYHRIHKQYPEHFPARRSHAPVVVASAKPKSYIGNGRWVDHVRRETRHGAIITMPRVSMIDGRG